MTEREESILTMHRSNQNTGLCCSQVDHDDIPRSMSQHISNTNVRSPFDKPERRKRASEHADSSRSEQKYSQEARLTASDTLRTDSSEDDTINKTTKASIPIFMRHLKHINETPLMKKPNPRIFSKESRSVVIKCNQRYSS